MDGMPAPTFPFKIIDASRNITYIVLAYCPLTEDEAIRLLSAYLMSNRRPKKNRTVTIYTVYGYDSRCA
jgi:hypothetical protein